MNSICILLTDHEGINEYIIIKSINRLKKSKIKKIYFLGDKKIFPMVFEKTLNNDKFIFINYSLKKKKYLDYLSQITKESISLFNRKKIKVIINMPLNKKKFFQNKFLGFTEFFSFKIDKKKGQNMLLYNENFSVCPVTTHVEIKNVDKQINKKKVNESINNVINFYKKVVKKKIQIIVLGLNPHASIDVKGFSKDKNVLFPLIKKFLKKKVNIIGPLSADTAFNNTKGKVYIGMYHDQVLIPFKIINQFDGINITIGKKILRLSPDHGTGVDLLKKKGFISNESFMKCINFCEKY